MKRLSVLFLLVIFLLGCLPVRAEEAPLPAFVTQTDGRFAWSPEYVSGGRALISKGSMPCSIANALIAAFDVTDPDQAADLLRETLVFSAGRHAPQSSPVDVNCLNQLPRVKETDFPLLARLCSRYADLRYQGGLLHADYLESLAGKALTESPSLLVLGRVNLSSELVHLAGMCDWLCAAGHKDAMVIVTMACTGMARAVNKPFGVPGVDHYVTLVLNADEYAAEGAFCLMDSLPRGLSIAEQQTLGAYTRYPFVSDPAVHAALRNAFEITRLENLALRFKPRAARNDADLSLLGLVNYGVILLCIP